MAPKIEVKLGSLTDGTETVLVNGSNTNVVLGSGVSGAIRKACGAHYQAYLSEQLKAQKGGVMPPGDVLTTNAGTHLRAKFVLHAAVMDYRAGLGVQSYPSLDTIRTCAERVWDAVETLPGTDKHSVAMIALGGGTGDLGVVEPTRIEAETLVAHLALHPKSRIERVAFYGYHEHEYEAIAAELAHTWPQVLDAMPPSVRARLKKA